MKNEKAGHTPGPWRCAREAMSMMQDGYNIMGIKNTPIICTAAIKPDGAELNGHEPAFRESEAEANAALIAAAPCLLAALELVKAHDRGQITGGDWNTINGAIAKAKGIIRKD